jgi:hypothetical protein
MDRPEPKFVPGELVLVMSNVSPKHNGAVVPILEASYRNMRLWRADGSHSLGMTWVYRIPVLHHIADGIWWGEKSLQKLPPEEVTQWEESIFQPQRADRLAEA